jgi:hypothetical protein
MLVPVISKSPAQAKLDISAVAEDCGTTLQFIDLPEAIRELSPQLHFALNLSPSTTAVQLECFLKRVPTTRVGFISEPPRPKKK